MPTDPGAETLAILEHMLVSSARRSELSAERSYQNTERNLALLTHSAAAVMILGLSVDRYLLFVHRAAPRMPLVADIRTYGAGLLMVALGTAVILAAGVRFLPYVRSYHRNLRLYPGRSAWLAPAFALLVGGGGIAALIYMLCFMA
ncbi:MAG: hypothetical protein ACRETQ_07475 [Gammaproteobacteria bacterium]